MGKNALFDGCGLSSNAIGQSVRFIFLVLPVGAYSLEKLTVAKPEGGTMDLPLLLRKTKATPRTKQLGHSINKGSCMRWQGKGIRNN